MTKLRNLSAKNIDLLVDIHEKGQFGASNRSCHSGTKTLESRGYIFQTSGLRKSVQWHITNEGEKYLIDAPLSIKGNINIVFGGKKRGFNSLKHFDWWCRYQGACLDSRCEDVDILWQELGSARASTMKLRGGLCQ